MCGVTLSAAPLVSVLTATHEPTPRFLLDAYGSLESQRTPWEWLLQLDGEPDVALPPLLHDDDRVRIELNGERLGTEPTRNLALRRARAPYLQNLDHDDFLLEPGFDATVEVLRDDGDELAFCFGDALDLLEDGRTEPNGDNRVLEPGRIERGFLFDLWERCGSVPLHTSGLLWRTEVLRAYGGRSAVPGSGDTATIMAVAEDYACFYLRLPTKVYRRHHKQTVHSNTYREHRERNWECAKSRVRATRALRRAHG